MKNILLLLGAILVLIVAGIFGLRYFMFSNGQTPTTTPNGNSFEEVGNLVRNNPGLKPDTWYLVYEEPGAPALTAELNFGGGSTCRFGALTLDCNNLRLNNGSSATVEGSRNNDVITVSRLVVEPSYYIRVTTPVPNQTVTSPIRVSGEARGYWYFEASFPVRLVVNGQTVTTSIAQAEGEWMTTSYVPFSFNMPYSVTATTSAELVLSNDNASGLPEFDKEIRIPITLSPSGPSRAVNLYYYNSEKDKDANGNILCSSQGLERVERRIPQTQTPLQDTIRLLLQGNLTQDERSRGITSEFPLQGVTLRNAVINNGTATLTFDDPNNRTGGGSCRVSILWAQIEATAKQFSTVNQVRFMPEELFQP